MKWSFRLPVAGLFDSEGLEENLAEKSVRAGGLVVLSQSGMMLISLLRTVILARLLSPVDFGLFGMVSVVVNFAAMFKDAGLSIATIQRDRISHQQVSALFWCNLLISTGIAILVCLVAPGVSAFYGRPELTLVTLALSLSILFSGIGMQHQALLRRHMRYGLLSIQQITAQLLSLLVAALLAWLHWRHWALVGSAIAYALSSSIFAFWACPWLPGIWTRAADVGKMIRFGLHLSGFNIINFFARSSDNVLIGKMIGAHALGVYERAYQILLLPITLLSGPLSHVAIPALSRIQGQSERQRQYYLDVLSLLALVSGMMAGAAYLSSDDIVLLLLGNRWMEVGKVFRILAIGVFFQPLYNTQSWLHLAMGRSDRVFRWGLIATPLIVASFIVGLPWGINGIALSYSLMIIVVTIGSLSYAGHYVGITPLRLCALISRPLCATVLGVAWVQWFVPTMGSALVSLLLTTIGYSLAYALFLLLLFWSFKPFRDTVRILQLMRGRKHVGR